VHDSVTVTFCTLRRDWVGAWLLWLCWWHVAVDADMMSTQVVRFEQRQTVDRYREHLEEVFMDVHCYQSVLHLSLALHRLLCALQSLPWQHDIASESVKDVIRFATVSMEVGMWVICCRLYMLLVIIFEMQRWSDTSNGELVLSSVV